jgi:hypothetical protein
VIEEISVPNIHEPTRHAYQGKRGYEANGVGTPGDFAVRRTKRFNKHLIRRPLGEPDEPMSCNNQRQCLSPDESESTILDQTNASHSGADEHHLHSHFNSTGSGLTVARY